MRHMECSRLGMILHLDIQKGKEAMKLSHFQKYIRSTAACMKRLMMDTKGCGNMTSNDTYVSYSWFSSVKMAKEAMATGVDYSGLAKKIHRFFCQATLENLMKYCPVGSYFVMEVTPRVPGGRPLLYIG